MSGNLFIVSAPSGAGKTSLVKALLAQDSKISLSVSYTTRAPREGEQEGKDYHFVTREQFQQMIVAGDFLESAEVYGNYYGTSQRWIRQQMDAGKDILLEIDWQGAEQVRRRFERAVGIFILPPSREALLQRLQGRGKDSEQVIAGRMAAVRDDVMHVAEFDYVIINDLLEQALTELQAVVLAARLAGGVQLTRHQELINRLQSVE